jgi:hypothetical protein
MDDHSSELSEGFRLLAHPYRRHAVEALVEHSSLTLADVAELVAEREAGVDVAEIPAEDVREVYLELYHSHVPKLVDARVVQYDQDRDVLALLGDAAIPWPIARTVGEGTTEGGVAVHLSPETADAVERVVAADDRLDESMSYDEVIRHVFARCLD